MKKLLLIALLSLMAGQPITAQEYDLAAVYRQIDEAIDQSPKYVAAYEKLIDEKRQQYQRAMTLEDKYLLAYGLYEQYKAFMNDSALAYLQQCVELATQMKDDNRRDRCRSLMAFQCSTVGLYTESAEILQSIHPQHLDQTSLADYYKACMHVCGELGYYTSLSSMRDHYYQLEKAYRDSLYAVIDHHSDEYLMNRLSELRNEENSPEALELSHQWIKRTTPDTHEYAIACYYSWLVMPKGTDEANYLLAQSALSDVRNAVMDQASLLALAEKLNADGDLERSYKYIRFTWDCNTRFNTRMRSWQITPILNVIENNYQKAMNHNTKMLWVSVIIVSVLALLLLGVLFFLHRRNRQLDSTRNVLHQTNSQLASLNAELKDANEQLSAKNEEFAILNSQLSESNRVKEEYIGRFMSLCSQYIDKIDDYRKMVNRKMKNKELDDLFRLSKSTELKEKELEDLYQNFDSVFLHLFPNFVNDFNALLQPDMRVQPKGESRLTTEIRIFALIRLGIEDSSKIAEFLHYSVNTIYNYRARIKNGALDNRESFERRVKQLGLIQ